MIIMICIVLIEPEHPGNIGAICRSMANFGLKDLILINPKCEFNCSVAIARAKHAKSVFNNIKTKDISFLESLDYVIGTTCRMGSDYNIPRSPMSIEQFKKLVKTRNLLNSKNKIGIIFGREGHGLHNDEISICDFLITIPTSKDYPSLNVSHSAAIMFYELFKMSSKGSIVDHVNFAKPIDKKHCLIKINEVLDKLPFSTKEKKDTQRKVWKRIVGKSLLTKREAYALMGLFRKIKEALDDQK